MNRERCPWHRFDHFLIRGRGTGRVEKVRFTGLRSPLFGRSERESPRRYENYLDVDRTHNPLVPSSNLGGRTHLTCKYSAGVIGSDRLREADLIRDSC